MIPSSFKIRDLTIRPAAVLAPMAGVTDTLFRRVIRGLGGCGLLMTEFTSSEGITRSAKKTLRYLYFQEDEHPITAQLFGADPNVMAEASKMVEDLGYDAVDINLGCPAKKVVKCGGSGLLRDMPLLEQIFRAVRAAVKIPLTIKLRAGWDENSIVAVDVAKLAESVGVEAIAVHPRTRMQGYAGQADWNLIAAVKQAVRIPVIGNGDINTPEDPERRVQAGVSLSKQRSERRISVRLPLNVRGVDARGVTFEEETSSENLCRNGAAFVTRFDVAIGSDLEIRIPFSRYASRRMEKDFATYGRVVHVADSQQPVERYVCVQFTGPRFQRVFRSESAA